jgi:site-specific recombinase XerC
VVAFWGNRALGRPVRPHRLRHVAITAVCDASGGYVRTAQRLFRLKDLQGAAMLLSGLLFAEQAR